ncbi:MAG: acetyltransferase [Halanaerobiales bacterium]
MKRIIIIGAGGHAEVVADIVLKRKELFNENIELIGFLDDKFDKNHKKTIHIFDKPVIGKVEQIKELSEEGIEFIIAIGDNKIRQQISSKYNLKYYTAIHPNSSIGTNVFLGEGTVVMANATINCNSFIGRHCIINTGSVIEHDNKIGDFVHISPGANLSGGVKVGCGSWIGIGSSIIQEIKIGSNTIIGAGSVVVSNIDSNKKAFGVPCKER